MPPDVYKRQDVDRGVVGQRREVELHQTAGHFRIHEQTAAALGQQGEQTDAGVDELEDGSSGTGGRTDRCPPRIGPLHQPRQLPGEILVVGPGQGLSLIHI